MACDGRAYPWRNPLEMLNLLAAIATLYRGPVEIHIEAGISNPDRRRELVDDVCILKISLRYFSLYMRRAKVGSTMGEAFAVPEKQLLGSDPSMEALGI